ncbi:hypothetical protein CROQUDRAFT_57754 [Cronartium quercuum f. sp. fusiforme G11]|uniref:VWFA domain-containing protein n=1 Tax=Cronartium quercuum f. sp. fusiforme G11 TaxID=708437 RepID=A0A9P6TFK1_9BASI|nr:hypothetical protein CROQUDRAFT_57754 [Cronartium quercuum f. sp. fusiforme G11]
MKNKLFRMSFESNHFKPPSGPPPPGPGMAYVNDPNAVPHGAASQYYNQASQYQAQPTYNPPSGPPPPQSGAYYGTGYGDGEDPFAMLSRFDTVVLVDDSGSMEMFWDETREALIGLVAKAVQFDADGIDLHFFNDIRASTYGCRTTQQVKDIFRQVEPRKSTPTANALKRVLDPYLQKLHQAKTNGSQVKPMNLIVLTDGAPDYGQDPEQMIVETGKFLDGGRYPLSQLGISFIQIGNDEEASRHLASLDDDLRAKHRIRDFVDCTPYKASDSPRVASLLINPILLSVCGYKPRKNTSQQPLIV